jgi:transcriptional regulator with XRE-family HTH domain
MTSTQCRKARALIGWSKFDLAARSKVDPSTARNFETRRSRLGLNNRRAMQAALEAAGIEFIGRDGVRRRKKPRLSPTQSSQLARLG